MKPPQYHSHLNDDLLRLLPDDARLVVDVGCGAGALGAAYRLQYPQVSYVGIELDPAVADQAGTQLTRVIRGDAERLDLPAHGIEPGSVDCMVYGDVLEHLIDPWALLQKHAALLKPDGCMIASIPNVQHWSMFVRLLRGQWVYEDQGLLDRTHLRFFSLDSLGLMFEQAGLRVRDVRTRGIGEGGWDQIHSLLSPAIRALRLDPIRLHTQLKTYQYAVRATRKTADETK